VVAGQSLGQHDRGSGYAVDNIDNVNHFNNFNNFNNSSCRSTS
jgi:hypothetical protein